MRRVWARWTYKSGTITVIGYVQLPVNKLCKRSGGASDGEKPLLTLFGGHEEFSDFCFKAD